MNAEQMKQLEETQKVAYTLTILSEGEVVELCATDSDRLVGQVYDLYERKGTYEVQTLRFNCQAEEIEVCLSGLTAANLLGDLMNLR